MKPDVCKHFDFIFLFVVETGLPLPYHCGTAAVQWCAVRCGNSEAVRWIILARELCRKLVDSHDASAMHNSTDGGKQHTYSAIHVLRNGHLRMLRCVCLSQLTSCESRFELRTSCDMQREYNTGTEYATQKEYTNMHVMVCSSVTAHRQCFLLLAEISVRSPRKLFIFII